MGEKVISDAAICQNCMIKFNEYDELTTKAAQLKDELIIQMKISQKSIKVEENSSVLEAFDDNFQLNDNFPEIDFDFGMKSFEKALKAPETSIQKPKLQKSEVSESFARILEKEGIKYDIEVFQRAFGDNEIIETEKKIKLHSLSEQKLTCDFCEMKDFKNRKEFISHLKVHRKSQFYCEVCQISFKTSNSLKIHLSSDHGNITENLPCPFAGCKKSFANKISLRAHFICHNKYEKDHAFFCDKCGKGFHYKLSFTQHLKTHDTSLRDKHCETCGFKAISTTHLQRHIRARHTREKNHVCKYCDRAFSEKYNMTSHIRKQHIEKKPSTETFHKCIVCQMEYSDDFKLKQHLELTHNIVEVEESENFVV